jgi:hypothetical protein
MQIPNKVTSSLWKGDDQYITSNITTERNINFLCAVHEIKAQRITTINYGESQGQYVASRVHTLLTRVY